MIINSTEDIIVTVNDKILKVKEDYIIEDNSLIFTCPPESNDVISIKKKTDDKTDY
jgi:hypothetical protein|tara:strand:+ start:5367 stop:5534 length:168 start_codon:yes stop_codon:yes gene_type:complete